ncbi:MAG: efflux transporter periplasmic adaptor subunit, partial [Acidiphilium sp. 21-66-27]
MAKRRGRIIFGLVALALAGAVAYRLGHRGKPQHRFAATAIPVKVAKAMRENVPVYLDALGTVVAYHTVTVQPMITGPLTRILF